MFYISFGMYIMGSLFENKKYEKKLFQLAKKIQIKNHLGNCLYKKVQICFFLFVIKNINI